MNIQDTAERRKHAGVTAGSAVAEPAAEFSCFDYRTNPAAGRDGGHGVCTGNLLRVFTLLVGNRAACFAGGLAGGLALAAAALRGALLEVLAVESLYMLHNKHLPFSRHSKMILSPSLT